MSSVADEQAKIWNGRAGEAWVSGQALLDTMLRPLLDALLPSVPQGGDAKVLDVGCGTGESSLVVAERLGPLGAVTGADISAPMLARARARAAERGSRANFVEGDAARLTFAAQFDLVLSRFGVMFFADPTAAFRNLHGALVAGGRLHFVCWRGAADNPFMTTAERAAAPLVPNLPKRDPNGPGQFAFADRDVVAAMLRDAGFHDIEITPLDAACTFPAAELENYVTRLGPLGQVLDELDPATRARVVGAVRDAFAPYIVDDEVRFVAACWNVRARSTPAD